MSDSHRSETGPTPSATGVPARRDYKGPKPAAQVLPHREGMLLLTELTECREGHGRSTAVIAPDNLFLDGHGNLEPIALVEMLAQGAAALRGYHPARPDQPPRIGYLVGIKRLEIAGRVGVGDSLTLQVHQTFAMQQVSILDGRVLLGDKCLASGTLKVWEEEGALPSPAAATSLEPSKKPDSLVRDDSLVQDSNLAPSASMASPIHRAVLASMLQFSPIEEGSQAAGEFRFDESFLGFRGHFPGHPILPGVVILKMALVMCARILGAPADLVGIEQVKFSGQVFPMQRVRMQAKLTPADEGATARVTLARGEDRLADLRLRVQAAGASPGPKRA